MKSGPIIIIEDDEDDKELLQDILKELDLGNELQWFVFTKDAIEYLSSTVEQPFIIFCDINLPGQNGIDFKKEIDSNAELRKKSIPFIFYTTSAQQKEVNKAFTEMTVQGFFKKGNSYEEVKKIIKLIVDYWSTCRHPNIF